MNHPRKLPQRAECPDMWGSDRDRPEVPGSDHTQKRTGDKTSLKRRDHPCYSFREIALSEKCSFSAEARRGAGHRTLLVWLSAVRWSPARRDHRCCAVTPALVRRTLSVEGESSSFNHYCSALKRKDELMRCTCCVLYSHGDQRQLDAMIGCQCPLARLITLEVDWSLWRISQFRRSSDVTQSDRLKGNPRMLHKIIQAIGKQNTPDNQRGHSDKKVLTTNNYR